MVKRHHIVAALLLSFVLFFVCCSKEDNPPQPDPTPGEAKISFFLTENFEEGSKTSYTPDFILLKTGEWYFNDAIITQNNSEPIEGAGAAKIQKNGSIRMNFDVSSADTIRIKHAAVKDAARWELWMSTSYGAQWEKCGQSVTTNGTSLSEKLFVVDKNTPVRFEIRKTDGGSSNPLTIDEFSISAHSSDATNGSIVNVPKGNAFYTENFSTGTKNNYNLEAITLNGQEWIFDNTAISGSSARMSGKGFIKHNFDLSSAATVEISYSNASSSGAITWQLWKSINGGATWSHCGSSVTSNSTTPQSVVINANVNIPVRFRIEKTSGGTSLLNIHSLTVTAHPTDASGGAIVPAPDITANNEHILLGNPSGAQPVEVSANNYLMVKDEYVLSYNSTKGSANWVSWHLDNTWIGSVGRQDDFRADPALYSGWYSVTHSDYTSSGFDRGHLCPSADRTSTTAHNSATFLMTNMIPQSPKNNQGPWANLEDFCRTLVSQGNELYIIAGGRGSGGSGSKGGTTNTIAGGKVNVPSHTWKVILVLPRGENDINRITTSTRTIAVDMPNSQSLNTDWKQHIVTVRKVEQETGLNFFSSLPQTIQDAIETRTDSGL